MKDEFYIGQAYGLIVKETGVDLPAGAKANGQFKPMQLFVQLLNKSIDAGKYTMDLQDRIAEIMENVDSNYYAGKIASFEEQTAFTNGKYQAMKVRL